MPHLSPMNWILMMITIWLTLSIISATMWWSFTPYMYTLKSNPLGDAKHLWAWLQDGRA